MFNMMCKISKSSEGCSSPPFVGYVQHGETEEDHQESCSSPPFVGYVQHRKVNPIQYLVALHLRL